MLEKPNKLTQDSPLNRQPPIFHELTASDIPFDLGSLHIVPEEDGSLSLKVMLKLPGDRYWRWVQQTQMDVSTAAFYAHAIMLHHQHSHPERREIMENWAAHLANPMLATTGLSLMIGIDF